MRDWAALKARYLGDQVPVRLGGAAANLARIYSFSMHQNQDEFVKMMIQETKYFIEWTLLDTPADAQAELVELQIQLSVWQRNWSLIWQEPNRRAAVADLARKWSDRLLELSGLLQQA